MDPERQACRELARLRWGETHWTCPRPGCGCREAYQLATRPRVFQCCKCGCQRSVTGATAFAHTKLPVHRLVQAFRACTSAAVPTARALAHRYQIAVSTAWHVVQRTLRVVSGHSVPFVDTDPLPVDVHQIVVRPSGGAPLPAGAPKVARACHQGGHPARLSFTVDDDGTATVVRVEPRPPTQGPLSKQGLGGLVAATLAGARTVSLRWAPRWIGGLASLLRPSPRGDWLRHAAALGPCSLVRLDPWRVL